MKHIRNRVFIQILIPTVILFILIIGIGLYYVNRSFETQVINQNYNELERASRAVHNWLVARISNLIQLSRTPLILSGQRDEILPFLSQERNRLSFIYHSFYYIYPDGSYYNTEGEIGQMETKSIFEKLQEEDNLFYYDGPVQNHPEFVDSIVLAVPVGNPQDISAVICGIIPLSTFKRVTGYFTMDEFESFMLVNPRSIIIVHSDESMIGKSERGEYGRAFSSNMKWNDYMVFVSGLRTTWKLVAFSPVDILLQPIRQINQLILLFFLLIVILIGIVSHTISNRVARPIRQLTEGVHEIIEGNYRQEIAVATRDELQELSEAFNCLSTRLVKLRTDDRFVFLGHISARLAHEIRKPLHIIKLAAQSLESNGGRSERHLQMIQNEVDNANLFISEILNFTRPEKLNLTRYSLYSLLEKIIRKYELVAAEKGIELDFTTEENGIHPFYLDIIKMEQAISNLLQNCVEALDDTEEPKRITVHLDQCDSEALITIEDTGPGFDDAVIDKILDPYFTTKENGTGLGMSISYRILTAHLARLIIENTPEHHARIIVALPL